MHEIEIFPDNPFDYLKKYSFKDEKEVYTNGSMLIPTYRVETMIAHYTQDLLDHIIKKLEDMKTSYNPYDSYYDESAYRATKYENITRNHLIEEIKMLIKEEL